MTAANAGQMVAAEVLKVRRKRSTIAWALVLAVAVPAVYTIYQGASGNGPGVIGVGRALNVLGLFIGPLAAVLIGAEAGAGDHATGVFRDLAVTGRSRVALFLVRVPGALIVCLSITALGYVAVLAATFALAGSHPTPSLSLVAQGAGWLILADGLACVLAVGLAAATASRPATITALIGWLLVASPLLLNAHPLGGARQALTDAALTSLEPGPRTFSFTIATTAATAIVVIVGWGVAVTAVGAWRTARRDA